MTRQMWCRLGQTSQQLVSLSVSMPSPMPCRQFWSVAPASSLGGDALEKTAEGGHLMSFTDSRS